MEPRRLEVLSPSWLAPRQLERRDPRPPQRLIRLRQRRLTLPVMVASIVSLVWRRGPSIAEVQQVWTREGVVGMVPLPVSPHALTTRLDGLPATVMGQLGAEVCTRLPAQPPPPLPHPRWAPVREPCPLLAMVDGSTREARRHTTPILRQREGLVVAGNVLGMGEAVSHRPRWQLSTADAPAHDQRCAAEILAARPGGGRLVCDVGWFSCPWCDDVTAQQPCGVTRRREQTASRPVQGLSASPSYRDEIIQVGQDRSNPCRPPRRLVSALWPGAWYRYLTHVLDAQVLSVRQVCELYRRRWRLEDAFALTQRLVEVADVWTGSTPAVPWQLSATLMCSAVRVTICQQVAQALGEPLERISVARVCRAFYHDSRAVQRGERDPLGSFLAEQAKLLGIVKRQRKAHRERQHLDSLMWGDPSVETDDIILGPIEASCAPRILLHQVQRREHGLMVRVGGGEYQGGQQSWHHPSIVVTVGAPHDPMHAFTVGTAGGLGFDDQVLQNVFAHDRIDHLVHPSLRLCQGGCGHAEEECWLPHHPLKIGEEDLIDTFFRTGPDVVNQTQEDFDEGIRDFLGPYITE